MDENRRHLGDAFGGDSLVQCRWACLVAVGAASNLSGDLVGSSRGLTVFAGNGPDAVSSSVVGGAGMAIYTLSESPCGAGTIVVIVMGIGPAGVPAHNTWQLGGGTGDLVNMTGSGTGISATDLSTTEYTGHISCGAHAKV